MHGLVVAVFGAGRCTHLRRLRSTETLDGGHQRPPTAPMVQVGVAVDRVTVFQMFAVRFSGTVVLAEAVIAPHIYL